MKNSLLNEKQLEAWSNCIWVKQLADNGDKDYQTGKFYESGLSCKDIDMEQLAMGIEIEAEHTKKISMMTKISLDHLTEFEKYYTGLVEMENQMEL